MRNVTIFNQSIPQISYIARTCTQGEEFDMVNFYIEHLVQKYSKAKNRDAAIFIEPQMDTGYPDIVVVEYYASTLTKPNAVRKKITTTDLKILYYIHCKKHLTLQELSKKLAYNPVFYTVIFSLIVVNDVYQCCSVLLQVAHHHLILIEASRYRALNIKQFSKII